MILTAMPEYPAGIPAFVDLLKTHEKFVPNWEKDLRVSGK